MLVPVNGYAVISSGALTYDIPANSPVTIVDNFPALNNDGDKIILIDFADTPVDSMWYDVAPSGNSMELISPGMRGEAYGWDVCVDQSGATPGRMNSIHYSQVPEEGGKKSESIILKVNPNPFPDVVTISYQLPFQLARIRLYVYDRRGRVVARIRDIDESGSEWTGTWDGRIKGTRLPAGPYILNLEALDKRTGKVYTERETIVIARKL